MWSGPQKCIQAGIQCTKNAPLCCGTCDNQYCCDKSRLELKQYMCKSCVGHFISKSLYNYEYVNPYRCETKKGEFCCGKCNQRFCCTNNSTRLNQIECEPGPIWKSPFFIFMIALVFIIFCVICCDLLLKKINKHKTVRRNNRRPQLWRKLKKFPRWVFSSSWIQIITVIFCCFYFDSNKKNLLKYRNIELVFEISRRLKKFYFILLVWK